MKLSQEDVFQKITITLETRREAEILWELLRMRQPADNEEGAFIRELSDLFSNEAIL